MTIAERILNGELDPDAEEVEDAVEQWHNGGGYNQPLHQWLGFTWEQYCAWVERP